MCQMTACTPEMLLVYLFFSRDHDPGCLCGSTTVQSQCVRHSPGHFRMFRLGQSKDVLQHNSSRPIFRDRQQPFSFQGCYSWDKGSWRHKDKMMVHLLDPSWSCLCTPDSQSCGSQPRRKNTCFPKRNRLLWQPGLSHSLEEIPRGIKYQ